jgi:hypothetical protein
MSVSVPWSGVASRADATFSIDSVGADPGSGDVVVAGAVDAGFDFGPDAVGTGAFVLKRAAADGSAVWATAFPAFAHGEFRTAVAPGGDVLFAGTAADPATIVTAGPPPAPGALVVGRLRASDGAPLWARGFDPTRPISAVAMAAGGARLFVAGGGSADFGLGDTGEQAFVAALSALDGAPAWSLGLRTPALSDVEARDDGGVVLAGLCAPSGATFEPALGVTCASGLLVAALGATGAGQWARVSAGPGTVTGVRDLAVAPDGGAAVVGDASGVVDLGAGPVAFGDHAASFAATWGPSGATASLLRPIEDPYAAEPDALALSRCAYDRTGRLWLAGRYVGAPTLGGVRFSACRAPACGAAAFLARLDADGAVGSFLPVRAGPDADGGAYVDDLALFATTGTVAQALRFTGAAAVGGATWSSAGGGLAVLRAVP